jgi:hypothetical protein
MYRAIRSLRFNWKKADFKEACVQGILFHDGQICCTDLGDIKSCVWRENDEQI